MWSSLRIVVIANLLFVSNATAQVSPNATTGIEQQPASALIDDTIRLGTVRVEARHDDEGFDGTGMGTYEQQLRDWPFANDLISAVAMEDDALALELAGELTQIAMPSAVDLATGDTRLSLRGFPTPTLRNGFVTMGAPDMLNTSRTIVIQGALVPVLGRAAPGGIQDFQTARPRTKPGQTFSYSMTSLQRQSASAEIVGVTAPKKAWHRFAADWSRRKGPEAFAANDTRAFYGAVAWRHSARASTLFSVDFQQVHATAAPGIPEYRLVPGDKIIGPYRPLAGFNSLGPEAGVRRRTTSAAVWFDGQPHPKLAVRAGLESWWRVVEQDRFTTSVFNIAQNRFEGTREPRHIEQPQNAALAHIEATGRFSAFKAEHKLMAAVSHTLGTYLRQELALPMNLRNALPESVRFFRPESPDYSRPPFSRETYSRVLADREERARYTAIELTERAGFDKGRVVVATGLRQDFVALHLEDRRPGTTMPHVKDRVGQLTYHFAANYQALPSRLLLFATTSTAFEPSTRVDARTGRIQGNDTTRGYEAGMKSRLLRGKIDVSASSFLLYNEDISRRNPLYEDPIHDANQTQPQLVAAGEERFWGGKFEARWKPLPPWTVLARAAYTNATTTASPDLPQEVGRALTRMPPYTLSASAAYSIAKGRLQGLSLSTGWNYVSAYTASYGDRSRYPLEYPGYGLVALSASYSKKRGKYSHGLSASVRNLFDYDLVRSQARVGAGREWVGGYRVTF